MARVLPSEVTAIIGTTRDAMPFILSASLLVDLYLGTAGYPALLLTDIEKWWAAHLIALADPQAIQTQLGDTNLRFQSPRLGMGLEGTAYGQQVLQMDVKGILSTVANKQRTYMDVF